jgi:outer membrane protein insertion porin family
LFWDVVWRNNLSYSFITGHEGNRVPFTEVFKLGGPYSLRGYNFFRIGKRVFSNQLYNDPDFKLSYPDDETRRRQATRTYGGEQMALYQTELEFPLIAEAGIKGVTFFDTGVADDGLRSSELYGDVGFGFRWFSPIGPLRFEWGFPLRTSEQSPDPVVFDFSIGAPF